MQVFMDDFNVYGSKKNHLVNYENAWKNLDEMASILT